MKKKEEIKYDLNTLKELFNNSKDNNVIAINLIDKALFLESTLKRLEQEMNDGDVIQDMPQGNYSIKVVNPVLKSYNTTIKNYQTIMKQINDMLERSFNTNDISNDEKELLKEYINYSSSHREWIENQKNNGMLNYLQEDEKRIKDYEEWKRDYLETMEEFDL